MDYKSVDRCPPFRMEDIDVKSLDIRELMDCRTLFMDTTEDAENFVAEFWEKAREIESEDLEKKVIKRKSDPCSRNEKVINIPSVESSSDAFPSIQVSSHSNCGSLHSVSATKEEYGLRSPKIAKSGPLIQYKSSPDTSSRDSAENEETEVANVNHEIKGNAREDGKDGKQAVIECLEKARRIGNEKKQTRKVKKLKKSGEKLKASPPKLRSGRCGRSETSANASSSSALTGIQASFPYNLRSNCSQVPSSKREKQKIMKSLRLALSKSVSRGRFKQGSSSKAEEIAKKFRAIWTAIKK